MTVNLGDKKTLGKTQFLWIDQNRRCFDIEGKDIPTVALKDKDRVLP